MILTGKNVHIYAQWPQWAKKGKKVQFILFIEHVVFSVKSISRKYS